MTQTASAYLNFAGEGADAIELYRSALGAEVAEIMHWKDMPGDVPEAMADRVMHCGLQIGGSRVYLSDLPPDRTLDRGTHASVLLEFDEPGALDQAFAALAEGGQVEMPVENTFWSARFGKVIDRFGIPWMMNCQLPQEG